jgi:uncharacterized protein (TIRG00374 family)
MKRWQFWAGLGISALFMTLALREVEFAAAWQYVRAARWEGLLLGWLCLVASYLVRAWRWRVIMSSVQPVPTWTVGRVYMAGLMANNLLPARIGEVVRAYLLGQTAAMPAAAALGTIAVERVFDVLVALGFLVVGAALGVLGGLGGAVWVGAALVCALVIGLASLALWGDRLVDFSARQVARLSPVWAGRLAGLGHSFVQGLRSIGSARRAIEIGLWSLGAWLLFAGYAAFVLGAYGLRTSLPGVLFLLGVGGMGVSIPSAPGNVGTLEGAYMLALQLLGVGDSSARASFALTYHVLEWVTTCTIGLLSLGQLGLSLGELSRMGRGLEPQDGT